MGHLKQLRGVVLLFVAPCVLLWAGCTGQSTSPPSEYEDTAEQVLSSKAELKERLEFVAESGFAGSGLAGIQNGIEQLRSTDAALADSLSTSLQQLEAADAAGNGAKVKQIAKQMAAKL
ncbi:hypothetical protein Mal4_22910 [Maioricimonas rarisocia]|uniref:Uncharacterized protein n=1 Tax=Maioricimonas rarisocia TaxID=2528026 RepID=A0A517Z644_9PLAN|nr:hypothetical protein [Maioricimonas rarisocia]QDU37972.1 hypothetical protein Mal4_22910 [Maioricimonas rarisocia]